MAVVMSATLYLIKDHRLPRSPSLSKLSCDARAHAHSGGSVPIPLTFSITVYRWFVWRMAFLHLSSPPLYTVCHCARACAGHVTWQCVGLSGMLGAWMAGRISGEIAMTVIGTRPNIINCRLPYSHTHPTPHQCAQVSGLSSARHALIRNVSPPHYLVSFHRNFCHHVAPQRSRRTDNRAKNIEWIGKSMFGISRWLEAKLSNNAMVCEGMFTRPPPLPGHLSMTAAHHTTLTPRGSQIFFYHQSSTRKSK